VNEVTRNLLRELAAGRIPAEVPTECEEHEALERLVTQASEARGLALALAAGDLSAPIPPGTGAVLGSLKALHANLRHLTWQTQQVATGDFSQRVDFMGEFSRAFNDMVEQLAVARSELVRASTRDALTGLYNRAFFDAELDRLACGRSFPVSVVAIDLDGLKRANDTYGHEHGDALIIRAGQFIQGAFRAEDVVARVGGDEFVVLLPGVDEAVGQRVVDRLRQAMLLANQQADGLLLSMSVGVATGHDGVGVRQAIKVADERMYADKLARRAGRAV
jgi:diguanylate cyclase (GGDEF)-like protein